MNLDSRSLSHAVALAEHRSFSRAARALGLTQPALSRSIQSLEASLGVRLFERNTKGVEPTLLGDAFVARAASILHEMRVLAREVASRREGGLARVAFGIGPMQVCTYGAPAVASLLRAKPQLEIEIRIDDPQRLVAALRDDALDLLVVARDHLGDTDGLNVRPLGEQPVAAYVHPAHPLLETGVAGWRELFGYPLALTTIAEDHLAWLRDARLQHSGRSGLINCDSVRMLRKLVAATDAIGFEPHRALAEPFESGEFVELRVDESLGALHPVIVWREDRALAADAGMLVELLLQLDREAPASSVRAPGKPRAGRGASR